MENFFSLLGIEYKRLLRKSFDELGVKIVEDMKLLEDNQWYFLFTKKLYCKFIELNQVSDSPKRINSQGSF